MGESPKPKRKLATPIADVEGALSEWEQRQAGLPFRCVTGEGRDRLDTGEPGSVDIGRNHGRHACVEKIYPKLADCCRHVVDSAVFVLNELDLQPTEPRQALSQRSREIAVARNVDRVVNDDRIEFPQVEERRAPRPVERVEAVNAVLGESLEPGDVLEDVAGVAAGVVAEQQNRSSLNHGCTLTRSQRTVRKLSCRALPTEWERILR